MASPPKRILLVEQNQDGTVGGSHQALFDLAVNLDPERFVPIVAFHEENPFADHLRGRGLEVHVLSKTFIGFEIRLGEQGWLRKVAEIVAVAPYRRFRFLKEHRIDLLHLNNTPLTPMDDWLPAAKLARVPCISNAMGDALAPRTLKGSLLLRGYDRVIAISEHVAEGLRRQGVPADRLALVYLGVDVDGFRARRMRSRAEVRAELGISEQSVLAVMAGNIREWKGQHVVIRALAQLEPDVRSRLRVAFAGAVGEVFKDYFRELEDAVSELGLSEEVTFLGGRGDLPDLFAAADIAIHASQIPEPFGLVVVEALAVGTPVLGGDAGGPAEILDPDCGILWDTTSPEELAQALNRLIADPPELARLASNAEARARLFDVDKCVQAIQAIYHELLPAAGS